MKPLSPHWADIAALKVINSRPGKEEFVVASGITPSGKIHVGNFREVVTVDFVARALRKRGKKVRFIYSWDNFDTFRKVPKNLPDPSSFEPYLRKAIARIPDPWGGAKSYAHGRMELFEAELKDLNIHPEFLYQEERYSKGLYASEIRKVLENVEEVKSILNEFKTTPLDENWLPTSIYCSVCEKDQLKSQKYLGGWDLEYECEGCGHHEVLKINESSNIKLVWRLDWPMRWVYEGVDFEPGGKDHSSQGGSFDTGKKIVAKIWGQKPPEYLQYDFVMIKGGAGKMSSSSGELYTLSQLLDVYEADVVRWIFSTQRPNHDFSISFDEDVIKAYEEFDKCEQLAYEPAPESQSQQSKHLLNLRIYELSTLEDKLFDKVPVRAAFRLLCNRLQICNNDIERTYEKFYKNIITTPQDRERFTQRAKCGNRWLELYAPSDFRYSLNSQPVHITLDEEQKLVLLGLRHVIETADLESIETKALNELIWQKSINEPKVDSQKAFQLIYQKLISRDKGPRLPGFLKEIGKERLLELLA